MDGTPADCVNLAIVKLLPRRPTVVVSGINRGGNLGDDVFYSGTVGAAREATFFGVPAIAVSLAARADLDYGPAAEFARRLDGPGDRARPARADAAQRERARRPADGGRR